VSALCRRKTSLRKDSKEIKIGKSFEIKSLKERDKKNSASE
jgi:hypothetical protein